MATLSYTTSLNELLAVLSQHADFPNIERCCVVRDLQGRLRLVIDAPTVDGAGLSQVLAARLPGWFLGPVLSTNSAIAEEGRIARHLLDLAKPWPTRWPRTVGMFDGSRTALDLTRFSAIERVLSKQAWLSPASTDPPWPLVGVAPKLLSFFSFKGGVGRSTTLAVAAVKLASEGKKVLCLDLDLEAPGLAALFQTAPEPGVIDYLLTALATGTADPAGLAQEVSVQGTTLHVVPAGRLSRSYVEKLARLDYLATGPMETSPVAIHLKTLLKGLRRELRPEYILLDSRAGLHDLGGLSLNDLSHVDVLVGRHSTQALAGLEATLELLTQRRATTQPPLIVVQTFAHLPLDGEDSLRDQSRYRELVHGAFSRTLYSQLADPPAVEDVQASHYPWAIGRYDELAAADVIASVSTSILRNDAFSALTTRIREVCEPEDEEDEDEEQGAPE